MNLRAIKRNLLAVYRRKLLEAAIGGDSVPKWAKRRLQTKRPFYYVRHHLARAVLSARAGDFPGAHVKFIGAVRLARAYQCQIDVDAFVEEVAVKMAPADFDHVCVAYLNYLIDLPTFLDMFARRSVIRIAYIANKRQMTALAGFAHRLAWHNMPMTNTEILSIETAASWAEKAALPVQVIAPADIDADVKIPESFSSIGHGEPRSTSVSRPPVALFELDNVTMLGNSLAICKGPAGSEYAKVLVNLDLSVPLDNPWTQGNGHDVELADPIAKIALMRKAIRHGRVDDGGILLTGGAARNYFHWLIEDLPKLLYLQGRPELGEYPLIVDANMPRQHYEALRAVSGNPDPAMIYYDSRIGLRLKRLLVPTSPTHIDIEPWCEPEHIFSIRPEAIRFVAERVHAAYKTAGVAGSRRIFIGRTGLTRNVTNEAEVVSFFQEHGFEFVAPEALTFEQQVRLFREASVIAAPSGSGLTNIIFASPGTKVVSLNSDHWRNNTVFAQIGRAVGVRVIQATGPMVESLESRAGLMARAHRMLQPFSVPVHNIEAALDS